MRLHDQSYVRKKEVEKHMKEFARKVQRSSEELRGDFQDYKERKVETIKSV